MVLQNKYKQRASAKARTRKGLSNSNNNSDSLASQIDKAQIAGQPEPPVLTTDEDSEGSDLGTISATSNATDRDSSDSILSQRQVEDEKIAKCPDSLDDSPQPVVPSRSEIARNSGIPQRTDTQLKLEPEPSQLADPNTFRVPRQPKPSKGNHLISRSSASTALQGSLPDKRHNTALHLNQRPRDTQAECCKSSTTQADVGARPTRTASSAATSKPHNEALLDTLL